MRLHHVQVSCPAGGEDAARRFYGAALGLPEVAKPPVLAARGGCWFRGDGVEVHVGVEEPLRAGPQGASGVPPYDARGPRRDSPLVWRAPGFPVDLGRHVPGLPAVPHRRRARQPGGAAGRLR